MKISLVRKSWQVLAGIQLLLLVGCVTFHPQSLPPQRTKAELHQILLKAPDQVVTSTTKPLPHGADEVWIFKCEPDFCEDRYYFQSNTLIAIDHVIYETL